jgi:outer membrane protein assembly factor BamB
MMWGSASDYDTKDRVTRVYVSNNNFFHEPLTDLFPGMNPAPTGGVAAALDAFDGKILWAYPNLEAQLGDSTLHALSQGPLTVANGVLFYPSMDAKGKLIYLNARTGQKIGSTEMGATNACGPAIVNSQVYSGSGYTAFGLGNRGNTFTKLALA